MAGLLKKAWFSIRIYNLKFTIPNLIPNVKKNNIELHAFCECFLRRKFFKEKNYNHGVLH